MRIPSRLAGLSLALGVALAGAACASKPGPSPETTGAIGAAAAQEAAPRDAPARDAAEVAGGTGPLTLETAVQRAVAWHPSITETVSRLQQQREAVEEANSGSRPRLSWGVDSAYDSNVNAYRPMLNLRGSQMVYDFGKVDGRIKVAEAGVTGRRTQILSAVDELARETAYAVIEIRRGNALKRVAQDQIADTREILELVKSRTDRGASTRSDLLQAESRVQAAESTLLEIASQINRWQSVLASLTGRNGRIEINGSLPSWLATSCAQGEPRWDKVPVVMRAQAEQEAARAQIGLTRAEGLPTLSLDGQVGSDLARIGSTDPEYKIGLNVSGSLYNGGESAARRNAANYALGASEAAVARARTDILRNLGEAGSQTASLNQLKQSLASREDMMRETQDLYQKQYLELGPRTLLDVLNAAQELHAARLDMRNIEHDIHKLNIDCTFNAGRLREVFSLEGKQVQGTIL